MKFYSFSQGLCWGLLTMCVIYCLKAAQLCDSYLIHERSKLTPLNCFGSLTFTCFVWKLEFGLISFLFSLQEGILPTTRTLCYC